MSKIKNVALALLGIFLEISFLIIIDTITIYAWVHCILPSYLRIALLSILSTAVIEINSVLIYCIINSIKGLFKE